MTDIEALRAHFSDPARSASIDPKRAIWLTEENIVNLSKDEKFMALFRARRRQEP